MQHNKVMQGLLAHVRAMRAAFRAIIDAPFTNSFTLCILGIAITLPLLLAITISNLKTINHNAAFNTPTISLYLKPGASQNAIDTLTQTLQNNKAIQSIKYISPKEGKKAFEANTTLGGTLQLFKQNPLPGLLIITPTQNHRSPDAMTRLFASIKSLPSIDTAQLDLNWATRLYDIMQIAQRLTWVLSLLFAAGIVLIVAQNLRGQLRDQQIEIDILRSIGATDAYIRRPFLYRGLLYGLLSGAIAWLISLLLISVLRAPFAQFAATYQTTFQVHSTVSTGISTLVIASLLAFAGAFIVVERYLRLN